MTERVMTEDGAWCWFQDPRAVYVEGAHKRTYAQWMTHDGKLQIGYFDHDTGTVNSVTLKETWDRDDHNNGATLVLSDKRLMVFYARHNQVGLYCRTATAPESIDSWGDEVTVSDTNRISYCHPVYLSDEKRFYVFWRGPTWKPTFATSADGTTWSEPQVLIQETGKESGNIRPYTKIVSDGKSSIHIAFTDGHPRNETSNSVYYVRYEEGRFAKADGSVVGTTEALPIAHSACEKVYDGRTAGRGWVWDIALDSKGFPVIAYTRLPKETDHRYCYARWTGEKWQDTELVKGGRWFPQTLVGKREPEPHYSGGMALNHSNPSILYLATQVNDIFEISRWASADDGVTWTSRSLTTASDCLNVRPVVPRGITEKTEHVLWMYGDYQHYTRYRTGIKLLEFKK